MSAKIPIRGNCYAASEALYHILGGVRGDWTPKVMRLPGGQTHWYLGHKYWPVCIDISIRQFKVKDRPNYNLARGSGFLTKKPSKRARKLMKELTWQLI